MARTLRLSIVLLLIVFSGSAFGQGGLGAISGRILDVKKQPIIGAVVEVSEGGIKKGGAITDYDGNYIIKPLDGGRYDVKVSYTGYMAKLVQGVVVSGDHTTDVNAELAEDIKGLKEVTIVAYKAPLINVNNPNATNITTAEQIEKMPTRDTRDIAATTPGVYQSSRGAELNIAGARNTGNVYIVDGVVMRGGIGVNLTNGSIDQVEVMTSGISAKYGDNSGGVVNITTKGVTSALTGDILAQHSIDGYNNNFVSFNLSGPLYKKMQKDGSKKPVLGFNVGGELYYDNDRSPSYLPTYVAKSSVEQNLQQNPLHIITDASTGQQVYKYSSEYITYDSLNAVKRPANNKTIEARAHAKFDYQLNDNINLQAGGTFDYTAADQFSTGYAMFAGTAIPTLYTYTGSGYLRFTQRFGKPSGENASSIISNAYYQVQADYQVTYENQQDPTFKKNIFDYAYVGKFNQQYAPIYLQNQKDSFSTAKILAAYTADSAHPQYGLPRTITGTTLFTLYNPDGVTYQRAGLNPVLANYTTEYYNSLNPNNGFGGLPQDIAMIQSNNGLVNGDLPFYTYQTFANVGQAQTYYLYENLQQYSLAVNASFDLQLGKTKHAIEFGLSYQQRRTSVFEAISNLNQQGTRSIWDLMRQLTNTQITIDKTNPIFIKNGKSYTFNQVFGANSVYNPSPSDTISYGYYANTIANNIKNNNGDSGTQSTFDRNLRLKLGLNPDGTDWINVDNYSPNTYSLNMFSADELLNSGNAFVYYYGYNYDGSTQTGTVNFNDFWTAKDKNGNYTRPIAPFAPNYTAGYILDNFKFKDIHFNVGLRIQRYDANTSVLKDPYSFYPAYTEGQTPGSFNLLNNGVHPANIGSGYTVYVNDNTSSSPSIIGYRSGDNWFDPYGNQIQDPSILKNYSGGRDPQPYLVNPNEKINSSTFNPSQSFVAYTPQVTLLPRLSFSFPITDVALFYAHYDIYAQRPDANVYATPKDYYYLQANSTNVINNPNLKPFETFDYEVGFQQKLTQQSSITISGTYKERKDMVEFRPYLYAWPATYYTYGNRDFSSTKGLTLKYDLRRINHLQARISYTLQFAEGTGSSPTSTNGGNGNQVSPYGLLQNFVEAGLPNLRYITALDYDSRHLISANFDYRYFEGEGPTVNGKHIFQGVGLNLTTSARSGEPYTQYVESDAISHTVIGGVNGSRLPWHYQVDLKLDKDFSLAFNRKHQSDEQTTMKKPRKPLSANASITVQNLFNTRDILHVYGYTGRPDDNGYLTSPQGQAYVANQTFAQSYMNIYNISQNNPGNYNAPRIMYIALQLNF